MHPIIACEQTLWGKYRERQTRAARGRRVMGGRVLSRIVLLTTRNRELANRPSPRFWLPRILLKLCNFRKSPYPQGEHFCLRPPSSREFPFHRVIASPPPPNSLEFSRFSHWKEYFYSKIAENEVSFLDPMLSLFFNLMVIEKHEIPSAVFYVLC